MGDWTLATWFEDTAGSDFWMVCRNGHLWQARLHWYDLDEGFVAGRMNKISTERRQRTLRCSLCQVLKAGNPKIRGITKVHPDYRGVITDAVMLHNGTIEHHHPEQVAKAYRDKDVAEWRAFIALKAIQYSMERRRSRNKV